MPSLQHMAALGGNNDTGWEGRWCEPDEALGLKRQRGRNESRTGQTVKWQHGTRTGAGRSDFSIHIKSSVYTYTHTHTHTRRVHPNNGNTVDLMFGNTFLALGSSPSLLLLFTVQVPFTSVGDSPQSAVMHSIWVFPYMWDDVIGN